MPRFASGAQEVRFERVGDDVVGDCAGWGVAPIENERGLAAHSQRARIDHEIQQTLPVVELEIGRLREMIQQDGMVLRGLGKPGDEILRLLHTTGGDDESEVFPRERVSNRARRSPCAEDARHAEKVR